MPEHPISNPRASHDDSFIQGKNWLSARINVFIDRHTPKCRETTRLLSQGMDAPLPLLVRLQLRLHFLMCCYCRRYSEQLRYMRKASRRFQDYSGSALRATLPAAVKEQIKVMLRREQSDRPKN
jgi:hypothetical protein